MTQLLHCRLGRFQSHQPAISQPLASCPEIWGHDRVCVAPQSACWLQASFGTRPPGLSPSAGERPIITRGTQDPFSRIFGLGGPWSWGGLPTCMRTKIAALGCVARGDYLYFVYGLCTSRGCPARTGCCVLRPDWQRHARKGAEVQRCSGGEATSVSVLALCCPAGFRGT